MDVSPALKKVFVEQVKIIYWRNKIAASTTNLATGNDVTELEVFEVRLNSPVFDDGLLRQIDREIPYHILFLLEYQGKYQAWIGYKEAAASGNKAFKVNGYYQERHYHIAQMSPNTMSVKIFSKIICSKHIDATFYCHIETNNKK